MAEARCLALLADTNKPYNVQGVSDMLASQGFKKSQVEKALVALAEAGKIACKEFGKQKLFIPSQEGLPELEPEEKDVKLAQITSLQQRCKELEAGVSAQRKELALLATTMTMEELRSQILARQGQVTQAVAKLATHRDGGAVTVSTEDRYARGLQAWEKYRRMFKDIWDTVSENMDANKADVFEEMGVETDEAIGEALASYQALLPGRKRAKGR